MMVRFRAAVLVKRERKEWAGEEQLALVGGYLALMSMIV
jgi:hypothetical protein